MSKASQKRRLARRWVAQRQNKSLNLQAIFTPVAPSRPCMRCSKKDRPVLMGQHEGRECTFWKGVGTKRAEVTGRVCDACVQDIRRAGPGGGLGMHGVAYHTRVQERQAWLQPAKTDWEAITPSYLNCYKGKPAEVAKVAARTRQQWAAWEVTHKEVGQGPLKDWEPTVCAPFVSANHATCPKCGGLDGLHKPS